MTAWEQPLEEVAAAQEGEEEMGEEKEGEEGEEESEEEEDDEKVLDRPPQMGCIVVDKFSSLIIRSGQATLPFFSLAGE